MPPRTPDARQMDNAWNGFVDFLRARRARVTQAREIVFRIAMGRADHFSADELAAQAALGRNRVSRGTVYRTLALMVESGFLRAVRVVDGRRLYESSCDVEAHEHLHCERCGRLVEFDLPELDHLIEQQAAARGFEVRGRRLVAHGFCAACRRGARLPNAPAVEGDPSADALPQSRPSEDSGR